MPVVPHRYGSECVLPGSFCASVAMICGSRLPRLDSFDLSSGMNTLSYNLYADAGRTSVWGDGTGGSVAVESSVLLDVLGWAPTQSFTVYGRIGAGQTGAVPGSYADTVSVTVTYY